MKRIIYIIALALLATSCTDWLDIPADGQVEAEKLFRTEKGFLSTLTGTYTLLLDDAAYGDELTAGFPDEIVRYWNQRSEFYNQKYDNKEETARLDATWNKMYEAIANTNLLLDYLEKNKDKVTFGYYDLIKGEALGLRAYLHLDLLRLYGPVLTNGLSQKAIPYHEHFDNKTVKLMTAQVVLDNIKRDLDEAYILLANDPIKLYGRHVKRDGPDMKDLAYNFRGIRMNYYAVCATLARYYMLVGNNDEALAMATEVIDATFYNTATKTTDKLFSLATTSTAVTGGNWMFETELVWSLYDPKIKTRLTSRFEQWDYNADETYKTYVYTDAHAYGASTDWRNNLYWKRTSTTPSYYYMAKYMRTINATGDDITVWQPVLPMIRLSELYYIAAEANLVTNPAESYRLLNLVRTARGVTAALPATIKNDGTALLQQLIYEYRKESWGEGKLFYLYKRLNHSIITRDETIPASTVVFELPIPADEIEHGNN